MDMRNKIKKYKKKTKKFEVVYTKVMYILKKKLKKNIKTK